MAFYEYFDLFNNGQRIKKAVVDCLQIADKPLFLPLARFTGEG